MYLYENNNKNHQTQYTGTENKRKDGTQDHKIPCIDETFQADQATVDLKRAFVHGDISFQFTVYHSEWIFSQEQENSSEINV